RVTALAGADAHPVAGHEVEVVVRDPHDTAIWRGTQKLPAAGMLAGEVPLGDDLIQGTYSLIAHLRGSETRETVSVRQVSLPAFAVRLDGRAEDAGPDGARRFRGHVSARYRYGEPVRGTVTITATGAAGTGTGTRAVPPIEGALDHDGRLDFALPLQ